MDSLDTNQTYPTSFPKKEETSDDSVFLILILCLVLVHLQLMYYFALVAAMMEDLVLRSDHMVSSVCFRHLFSVG